MQLPLGFLQLPVEEINLALEEGEFILHPHVDLLVGTQSPFQRVILDEKAAAAKRRHAHIARELLRSGETVR